MSNDEKWLDELLDRTEKEEILDSLKRALTYLDDLDVRKAYNVLELLYESMGGDYDAGKYEGYVEKVKVEPRAWSTGGTIPTPSPPHNHGDHYAHDHSSLANLDEELEQMSVRAMEQVLADLEQRMVQRDEDLLEMARVWEGYAEKAEKHMQQINVDQHLFEKITGVTAPIPEEESMEESMEYILEKYGTRGRSSDSSG